MIIVCVFYSRVLWMLTDKIRHLVFLRHSLLALMAAKFNQEVLPDDVARVSEYSYAHTTQVFSVVLLI